MLAGHKLSLWVALSWNHKDDQVWLLLWVTGNDYATESQENMDWEVMEAAIVIILHLLKRVQKKYLLWQWCMRAITLLRPSIWDWGWTFQPCSSLGVVFSGSVDNSCKWTCNMTLLSFILSDYSISATWSLTHQEKKFQASLMSAHTLKPQSTRWTFLLCYIVVRHWIAPNQLCYCTAWWILMQL